jgi:hypothetical protein
MEEEFILALNNIVKKFMTQAVQRRQNSGPMEIKDAI